MTRECEDAISRQAVLKAIKNLYPGIPVVDINGARLKWLRKYEPYFECEKVVKQLPPITPQPKMGHWIGIDEEPHEDYECNRCGYVVSTYTANIEPHTEYKYCPNCGLKMEEGNDKEPGKETE